MAKFISDEEMLKMEKESNNSNTSTKSFISDEEMEALESSSQQQESPIKESIDRTLGTATGTGIGLGVQKIAENIPEAAKNTAAKIASFPGSGFTYDELKDIQKNKEMFETMSPRSTFEEKFVKPLVELDQSVNLDNQEARKVLSKVPFSQKDFTNIGNKILGEEAIDIPKNIIQNKLDKTSVDQLDQLMQNDLDKFAQEEAEKAVTRAKAGVAIEPKTRDSIIKQVTEKVKEDPQSFGYNLNKRESLLEEYRKLRLDPSLEDSVTESLNKTGIPELQGKTFKSTNDSAVGTVEKIKKLYDNPLLPEIQGDKFYDTVRDVNRMAYSDDGSMNDEVAKKYYKKLSELVSEKSPEAKELFSKSHEDLKSLEKLKDSGLVSVGDKSKKFGTRERLKFTEDNVKKLENLLRKDVNKVLTEDDARELTQFKNILGEKNFDELRMASLKNLASTANPGEMITGGTVARTTFSPGIAAAEQALKASRVPKYQSAVALAPQKLAEAPSKMGKSMIKTPLEAMGVKAAEDIAESTISSMGKAAKTLGKTGLKSLPFLGGLAGYVSASEAGLGPEETAMLTAAETINPIPFTDAAKAYIDTKKSYEQDGSIPLAALEGIEGFTSPIPDAAKALGEFAEEAGMESSKAARESMAQNFGHSSGNVKNQQEQPIRGSQAQAFEQELGTQQIRNPNDIMQATADLLETYRGMATPTKTKEEDEKSVINTETLKSMDDAEEKASRDPRNKIYSDLLAQYKNLPKVEKERKMFSLSQQPGFRQMLEDEEEES